MTCDATAATCYRVLNADNMEPKLQVKISYILTFHIHGIFSRLSGDVDEAVKIEISKVPKFVFEKVTTTTSRDWNT